MFTFVPVSCNAHIVVFYLVSSFIVFFCSFEYNHRFSSLFWCCRFSVCMIGFILHLIYLVPELLYAPLRGKVFIITGANTGLGYETARALAARQATVIMACRSMERAGEAIRRIRQHTPEGELIPIELDLASFASVRDFSEAIKSRYPSFDCLINNAGLAMQTPTFTKENYEVHYGVNHLGHFLLVDLLKDNIRANAARIVIVSSKMHERAKIDFDNLGKWVDRARGERTNSLYNNSKLMNFYHARELYKQGYNVHVLCPGLCHTDFFRSYNPKWYHYVLFSPIVLLFLRSARQVITTGTEIRSMRESNAIMFFRALKTSFTPLRTT